MINYFFEQISPIKIDPKISIWIENLIQNEGKKTGDINYIFCDDNYLLKINQDFLIHDYYTDVITFDYVKGKIIAGDIFVSLQRISENSHLQGETFDNEFKRVLAHGVLHLCGYKDKSEMEQKQMREKEDFYLSLY